jgi:hypothetical protein
VTAVTHTGTGNYTVDFNQQDVSKCAVLATEGEFANILATARPVVGSPNRVSVTLLGTPPPPANTFDAPFSVAVFC